MLITDGGVLVRTRVNEISIVGRNTQGVKVIRLDATEKLVGVDKIDGLVEDESDEELDELQIDAETQEMNEAAKVIDEQLDSLDSDEGESENE